MFKTQAEMARAHIRCRRSVNGLIVDVLVRFRKMPIPDTTRAADEDTSVRLSHCGVVSRRLCTAMVFGFNGAMLGCLFT